MPGEDKDEPITGFVKTDAQRIKSEAAYAAFAAERRGDSRPFQRRNCVPMDHARDCPRRVLPEAGGICVCGAEKIEAVDHPRHYNVGNIEVIDAIEDWKLGFHEGNVVKYVARSEHKGNQLEDLKKARWYLQRRIEKLEGSDG